MLQTSLCRPAESPHGRQVSKDRTDVTQLKHNPRSHFVPSAELQKDYNCQALGKDSSWPRPWLLPPRLHRPRQFLRRPHTSRCGRNCCCKQNQPKLFRIYVLLDFWKPLARKVAGRLGRLSSSFRPPAFEINCGLWKPSSKSLYKAQRTRKVHTN